MADQKMSASSCPLCGTAPLSQVRATGRSFNHCGACDLISVPACDHLSPAAQRERYLRHRNSPGDGGYVRRFDRVIELVRRHAPAARRILDYGCGPVPVFIELLRRAGYEADGYDPLFRSDTVLTPTYDAIVSVETFEHFARPREEIARIVALLGPGGLLAVMTQLHAGPEAFQDWWYARDKTHVAFYSTRTFDHIRRTFGVELRECDGRELVLLRSRGARS